MLLLSVFAVIGTTALNLIIFVIVLTVIVSLHELGHFYFAKRAGILCHEFAVGMGPALYQKRKGETVYSIRAIPLGGYVAMAGESINDALIKVDQMIGINLNAQGQIYEIILNDNLPYQKIGKVVQYELYGKDFDPLFIELEIENEVTRYPVLRDAIYRLSEKKEMWITPAEKSFESKSLWQRFLVIFAGPAMNFILALILYLFVGFFVLRPNLESNAVSTIGADSPADMIGLESGDIITDINGTPINSWSDISTVMSQVNQAKISLSYTREGQSYQINDIELYVVIQMAGFTNYTADGTLYHDTPTIGLAAGRASSIGNLEPGDVITDINDMPIANWDEIVAYFRTYERGEIKVEYLRDGQPGVATYELISANALNKLGSQPIMMQIGISPESNFHLGYSLAYPFRAIVGDMTSVVNTLGLLFDGNENLGLRDLAGPIGIFTIVSQTSSRGFLAIVSLAAFLSINIGVLNLLPIPALDGGRLVFLGIEAVGRRPVPKKIENTIINVTMILLLILFVYVAYNDILRLIVG